MMRLVWWTRSRSWELKDLSKRPTRTGFYVVRDKKASRFVVTVRVVPPARCMRSFTTLEDAKAYAEVSYKVGVHR